MAQSRRPAAILLPGPTVTQHQAFWTPFDKIENNKTEDGKAKVNKAENYETWIEEIEKFILELYSDLKEKGLNPIVPGLGKRPGQLNVLNNSYALKNGELVRDDTGKFAPTVIEKRSSRNQTYTMAFTWQGAPVTVRFGMLDEAFTFSTSIDLSKHERKNGARLTDRVIEAIGGITEKSPPLAGEPSLAGGLLPTEFRGMDQIAAHHYRPPTTPTSEAEQALEKRALASHYNTIYRGIWNSLNEQVFAGPFGKVDRSKLGAPIVDFRGLVLRRAGKQHFFAMPGQEPEPEEKRRRLFARGEDGRCARAIAPFMQAEFSDDEAPTRREVSISKFLGDHIYATALGAQPPGAESRDEPLTYLLLAANDEPERTSWLIDLMHMLGTLRIAALKDLDPLNQARVELQVLESEIDEIAREAQGGNAEKLAAAVEKLKENLPRFSQRLAEIGQRNDKGEITGGVALRVERSEFYQDQFERLTGHLGIQEIGGFVSYQKAVIGRLGGLHEIIKLTGKAFARIQQTLNLLTGQLQMAESIKTTGTSATMLHRADLIIWQFFVPYYGPDIASKFFEKAEKAELFQDNPYFTKSFYDKYDAYVRIGLLVLGTYKANKHRLWKAAVGLNRGGRWIGRKTKSSAITSITWTRGATEVLVSKSRGMIADRPARLRRYLRRKFRLDR